MTEFEAMATELVSIDTVDLLGIDSGIQHQPQVGFDAEELVSKPTYVAAGIEKLTALCHAVGLEHKTAEAIETFRAMTLSWGDRRIRKDSSWQSNVSDDGAPFEFSIAFKDDRAELRILLEAQGSEPNLQSNWEAGLNLNHYLAERYQVSLDRFKQIEDLFVPTNPDASFSIWHSACFYPDKEPSFKIYLNPQAQSESRAAATCEESLVRLGFDRAWSGLAEIAAKRGSEKDKFAYFSLDLDSHSEARVKIYLRHYDITVDALEEVLSLAQNYVTGDAAAFCKALTSQQNLFTSKPIVSCFSFIEGNDERPANGTLYIPIGYYVANDGIVFDLLNRYFIQHNLPVSIYTKLLQSFSVRSLDSGCGMHSHISMRREQQECRLVVYLNPEVNSVRSFHSVTNAIAAGKPQLSIEQAVSHYAMISMCDYPFFQRLSREPVNLEHLWLLFVNGYNGVVSNFTRRLALVVAHIDSEHIRCILAKQLNEELGNGDVSQVHRKIFENLIISLESHKPQELKEEMLLPGQRLSECLETLYSDSNPSIGLGAAIMMEVRGKQRDEVVGKELARTSMDCNALSGFHLHGELEKDHAEEVIDLARSIDNSSDCDRIAVLQGAEITSVALWDFCNDMYRVCFM
jgi:DMATS type aromatic prenyltransferase